MIPSRLKFTPRILKPGERLLNQMVNLGGLNVSQPEAAAVLGVNVSTLQEFWVHNPEYREAYEAGKSIRKFKIRALIDMHAVEDAPTARFLAKNELGMSDDPSKARADEANAGYLAGKAKMSREEAERRINELRMKLIEVPRETEKATEKQVAGPQRRLPQGVGRKKEDGRGEKGDGGDAANRREAKKPGRIVR